MLFSKDGYVRIELTTLDPKSNVFPIKPIAIIVENNGIEPLLCDCKSQVLAI